VTEKESYDQELEFLLEDLENLDLFRHAFPSSVGDDLFLKRLDYVYDSCAYD